MKFIRKCCFIYSIVLEIIWSSTCKSKQKSWDLLQYYFWCFVISGYSCVFFLLYKWELEQLCILGFCDQMKLIWWLGHATMFRLVSRVVFDSLFSSGLFKLLLLICIFLCCLSASDFWSSDNMLSVVGTYVAWLLVTCTILLVPTIHA